MLTATFDDELGLIVTIATGFQSEQDVEQHLARIEALARTARARTGRALHLVDATEAAVQPPAGSRSVMREAARGRIRIDRCAVVMVSALGKMQVMRLYRELPLQVFGNREDGIAWLRAFQPLAVRVERGPIGTGCPRTGDR